MKPTEITKLMLEKKAQEIKIFDVRKITTLTDYFIICTSESDPQTKAIVNHVEKTLRKNGLKASSSEGVNNNEWVILDYIDIIVHIFSKEKRDFYNLDRLWADAKITKVEEQNES
tara:strand:+ start:1100 stop:1444 length:345 start_codon:yes stop_codon:yes gene_type:complete